jgi:hypothetical protein
MRPGAIALHYMPARYNLIESHIFVPLGGIIAHRWWYKLWALLGGRNKFQKDLSADETADRNAFYFVAGLNYVSNSLYEVVWKRLGYERRWIDQEHWDTSDNIIARAIGRCNRVVPIFSFLNRTFRFRMVMLKKVV